jgi:hypothetical protein
MGVMNLTTLTEFLEFSEGTLLVNKNRDYFIKPEQSFNHHLNGCLINLITGKIIHFSRCGKLIPVYGSEIMW